MRLLIFDFGSYTYEDIYDSLRDMGVSMRVVSYSFRDKNNDEFFEHRFSKVLHEEKYDAVFSVNFFPLVAKCCYRENIKYISWSYDNPLNVKSIEETLGYPTNYVFLFDRIQCLGYINKGFTNIYHMPLAVNPKRLEAINLTKAEHERFDSEISFVGKLYDTDFAKYRALTNDFQKGFIDSTMNAQKNLYGGFLLENSITEEFVEGINASIKESHPDSNFKLNRESLIYAMSAEITRNERLTILGFLSRHHELKMYTREKNEILSNAKFCGSCGYLDEMPRIFKASKVNLNISLKCIQSGIPLRCMDICGAGGFLLSNYQPELDEFFINGEEIVLYESVEDAIEKAEFYLKHDDLRRKIAANGHIKVVTEFNYKNQFAKIFEIAGLDV